MFNIKRNSKLSSMHQQVIFRHSNFIISEKSTNSFKSLRAVKKSCTFDSIGFYLVFVLVIHKWFKKFSKICKLGQNSKLCCIWIKGAGGISQLGNKFDPSLKIKTFSIHEWTKPTLWKIWSTQVTSWNCILEWQPCHFSVVRWLYHFCNYYKSYLIQLDLLCVWSVLSYFLSNI